MDKIYFRLVYNRKKKLNKSGKALIQVEAYRKRKKVYISTGIYVNPQEWDSRHSRIIQHRKNGTAVIVELSSIRIRKN